ncbi:MAG: hypothetical protein IIB02_01495 [Thaumarchaeota archaeon]|nr:hypothetical protein [Nitrososphaerota archaeon]
MQTPLENVIVKKESKNEKNIITRKESENEKNINKVNVSYGKRVEEAEHFSKHIFNLCADLNAESLHDCLNIAQHYADMQKKYSNDFPTWYPTDNILSLMERNNHAWVQAVENTDSMYTNILNNCKSILRMCNENYLQSMKYFERNYEFMQKNTPKIKD